MVASFIDFGSVGFSGRWTWFSKDSWNLVFPDFWILVFGLFGLFGFTGFLDSVFQTLDCDPSNQSIDLTNVVFALSRRKSTNAGF